MRKRTVAVAAAVTLAATVLAVARFTSVSASEQASGGRSPAGKQVRLPDLSRQAEISRVHTYKSVSEMTEDATDVVVASPTGDRSVEMIAGAPFYVLDFRVSRVFKGDSEVGQTVKVRTFTAVDGDPEADPGATTPDGQEPVLATPTNYLLFLEPFHFDRNGLDDTGQYVVLGEPAGMFMDLEDLGHTFHKVDPESPKLPVELDLTSPRVAAQLD